MLQYLATNLVGQITLPGINDPSERGEAMIDLELDDGLINICGLPVPADKLGFSQAASSVDLVIRGSSNGLFSWSDHFDQVLDLIVEHDVHGIATMTLEEVEVWVGLLKTQKVYAEDTQSRAELRRLRQMDPTQPGLSRAQRTAIIKAQNRRAS